MDAIKYKWNKLNNSVTFKHFLKFGAPMFVFVIGGSFLLEEFQKVRWDYKNNRYNQKLMDDVLKEKKIDKIDMKAEYEKIKKADTSNYRNIRGPRAYEDNLDFLKNRELQERRLAEITGRAPP